MRYIKEEYHYRKFLSKVSDENWLLNEIEIRENKTFSIVAFDDSEVRIPFYPLEDPWILTEITEIEFQIEYVKALMEIQ